MSSRLAAVSLLSLMLTGCPSMHVNATVTAAPSPAAARGSERAGPAERLAGASVSMDCPQAFGGDGKSLLGRTDAGGELHFREPGPGRWIHDACDLVVEMPGFQERRLPVASVCKEYSGNHCIHAVVTAQLVRR
ncbi:MAG: hypothetical protein WKG00_40200 [Polyangiaceae bacterium]